MEIDNEEESSLYSTNLYAMECSDFEEGSLIVSYQYSRQPTTKKVKDMECETVVN